MLTYGYDELGRVKDGPTASAKVFDALGRLTSFSNQLGALSADYIGKTGRIDFLNYPNGQKTDLDYATNVLDVRLKEIKNLDPTSTMLSQFKYLYDKARQITEWEQPAGKYVLGYDAADQLVTADLKNATTGASIKENAYRYDLAANRTSEQADAKLTTWAANRANQLTSQGGGTGPMRFSGTVSEPSTVSVAGSLATVTGNSWEAYRNVVPGQNNIPVVATETNFIPGTNAQVTSKTISVNVTSGAAKTFAYDANGAMTSDGGTQTMQWDQAGRIHRIDYVGTTNSTEFVYDGLGRRVKILELTGPTITNEKRFCWEGMSMFEERAPDNSVQKRFFGVGEWRVGDLKLFYTRDHLGSIRELTDFTGAVRARYAYDVWGDRTKISGDLDSDFGFTGHYTHGPSKSVVTFYRIYRTDLARWLSPDPIEEEGGLNLYGYVGNNPTNATDPHGLWAYFQPSTWFDGKGYQPGFLEDGIGQSSQAALDGIIPIWDPFADHEGYDDCDPYNKFSRKAGEMARDAYLLAVGGRAYDALGRNVLGPTSWDSLGTLGKMFTGRNILPEFMKGASVDAGVGTLWNFVAAPAISAYGGVQTYHSARNAWDVITLSDLR